MDYKSNKAKKCFKNKQGLVMLLIDEFAPVTKQHTYCQMPGIHLENWCSMP